ncbi:ARM repeat superfamily protein [Striga asiatica]|uniref:ARM repeat superfamily protein n=1 Tax=Striga asiatica TaxID=4170 RepID=A0A5A7P897_STRAF|nr:ARM repeat superfamily protein [Striga asiatica]
MDILIFLAEIEGHHPVAVAVDSGEVAGIAGEIPRGEVIRARQIGEALSNRLEQKLGEKYDNRGEASSAAANVVEEAQAMVKFKAQSKKAQKRGVDFKKIKRKIGRKLPPPKNATNTEIKSKAIVLPEQSIVSEKAGLAVSRKGLTLKELLQQTSHHNGKVRKDALLGMKDILLNHPVELKLHKLSVIEKLRERIGDDDKVVRETLYQLFKSVIFPGCGKDNQGPLVSLMMAYIFNAMTHLALDVRLMAFKFFDLIVQFYPSSFFLYAEKYRVVDSGERGWSHGGELHHKKASLVTTLILQNYEDILRKNQFVEDKSKLKSILAGLIRCLSLLPCNHRDQAAVENDVPAHDILHAFESDVSRESVGLPEIVKPLKALLPILVGCFQDFIPLLQSSYQLDLQSFDCLQIILQSVDLMVRFLAIGICKSEPDLQIPLPFQKTGMNACDQLISPLMLKKLWDVFPLSLVHHLSGKLSNWDHAPYALFEKFLEFIETSLATKVQSGKVFHEKHLLPLIPYIPKLTVKVSGDWRSRILMAFTEVFKNSSPESAMKLACLSAVEEMLAPERSLLYLDTDDPTLFDYQIAWIQYLPSLLILLDDKSPSCSKAVLRLQLRILQGAPVNSPFSQEFDTMQYSFKKIFSQQIENAISYGPFMRLAADIQELAICCLYYISFMDSQLLQSLVSCCLCDNVDRNLVVRIIEVLHSAYRAGHIQVADYISFHVTLLARFQVTRTLCANVISFLLCFLYVLFMGIALGSQYGILKKLLCKNNSTEKGYPAVKDNQKPNWKAYKSITCMVCSCLSQIGDDCLIFQMMEKIIVDQLCGQTPLDNKCAFLRLLTTLGSKKASLSDQSIVSISSVLPKYLTDVVSNVGEGVHEPTAVMSVKRRHYYLLPVFYLFYGSKRLLSLVLNLMGFWISESSSSGGSHHHIHPSGDRSTVVCAIGSVLSHMYKDVKIRPILLSCKIEMETMVQNLLNLLSSEETNLTLEERHKIQTTYGQLKAMSNNDEIQHF